MNRYTWAIPVNSTRFITVMAEDQAESLRIIEAGGPFVSDTTCPELQTNRHDWRVRTEDIDTTTYKGGQLISDASSESKTVAAVCRIFPTCSPMPPLPSEWHSRCMDTVEPYRSPQIPSPLPRCVSKVFHGGSRNLVAGRSAPSGPSFCRAGLRSKCSNLPSREGRSTTLTSKSTITRPKFY